MTHRLLRAKHGMRKAGLAFFCTRHILIASAPFDVEVPVGTSAPPHMIPTPA